MCRQSKLNMLLGVIVLACLALPVPATTDTSVDPIRLQVGTAFIPSQLQHAGQKTDYVFEATGGNSYLIQVGQNGLDFFVYVEYPNGAHLSYNSPLERDEPELILLENAETGDYRITLTSEEITDVGGDHSIKVSEIETRSGDSEYRSGLRMMSAGAAAYTADEWVKKEEALAAYEAAAKHWEKSGRTREYAQALYTVAYLKYWVSYDNAGSVQDAAKAADLYLDPLDEQTLYANAKLLSAAAMLEDLEFDHALARAKEALLLHEKLGNPYDAARAEELIGYAYHRKGELPASVEYRRRAADRFTRNGEWFKAFTPLARAAIIEADRGYSSGAINVLEDIRKRLPERADPFFVAELLDGLGDAYRLNGSVNEALKSYDAALEQHRRNGDVHGEASALRGIGKTYLIAGHLDLAAGFLSEAAVTAEGSNIQIQEQAFTALGTIDYLKGNYEKSLRLHQQALALLQSSEINQPGHVQTMSKVDLSNRLVLISRDLTALNQYGEARTQLAEAKRLLEGIEVPFHNAAADHELGRAYLGSSQVDQAVQVFNRGADRLRIHWLTRRPGSRFLRTRQRAPGIEIVRTCGPVRRRCH